MGTENTPSAGGGAGSVPGRTWNSGLSVAEFACLRTTGFEPVGQVMGASVYRVRPWTPIDSKNRYWSPRFFAGGEWGIYNARRKAMNRLVAECRALGGDGIIAVQVEIGPFQGQEHTLAFRVRGTAVRAHGRVRPLRPFSSDLSAQEFAKLIEAGWVPVELVLGVSINQLYDFPGVKSAVRRQPGGPVVDRHGRRHPPRGQVRTPRGGHARGRGRRRGLPLRPEGT
jgi:uncharacterized protein YbjQ (UPF0145 family)